MEESMDEYLDNVSLRPEFIGLASTLNPFPGKLASARNNMFSGNLSQFVIPKHGEHPYIFTGFESIVADYCSNSAEIEEDIKIIAIVPKFRSMIDIPSDTDVPETYIFYIGLESNELGYFVIRKYTKLSKGYGYKNNSTDSLKDLMVNEVVSKGTKLYTSPAHVNGEYRIGVNANIVYMTDIANAEDAFRISESLAKKLQPDGVTTFTIDIKQTKHCLNLYGNAEEYKIFPDIGSKVRDDGILCAFRTVKDFSIMNDLHLNKLNTISMHDESIKTVVGAKVVDINVYLSSKCKLPISVFDQLIKYKNAHVYFYKSILSIYEEYIDYKLTNKANSLFTRAISMLLAFGEKLPNSKLVRNVKMTTKRTQVDMRVEITLAYPVRVNNGFKSTGRDGGKGVIGIITPDDEMPVDEHGIRADITMFQSAVIKRTNVNQLFEQFINRTSMFVSRYIKDLDTNTAYEYVLEYISMLNTNYADLIRKTLTTQEDIEEYVRECKSGKILINIPPMTKGIDKDLIIKLADKYGSRASRISFVHTYRDGSKEKLKSLKPIMIGPKYIYLLFKYPKASSPSIGYDNQFKIPVKPSNMDYDHMSRTPIRFGEDEFRMISTAIGADPILRLRCLLGTSEVGKEKLLEELLATDEPHKLGKVNVSLKELQDNEFVLGIINSSFEAFGVNVAKSEITEEEANVMFKAYGLKSNR
jgi:hypothetical protein